jgi:hypothetical protein
VGQTSNIAVQNVGVSTLSAVTVTYYSRAGAVVGYSLLQNIEPNRKISTRPEAATWWDPAVPVSGYLGSAVVESPDGPVVSVVNITSAPGTSTNIAAAFNGINGGCEYVAIPYVRWYSSSTAYRTYIAVQNVGSVPTDVEVMYYNRSGTLVGTDSTTGLNVGVKWNTNVSTSSIPSSSQNDWQGTVIIHATTPGGQIAGMVQAKRNDGMQASNFLAPCFTP